MPFIDGVGDELVYAALVAAPVVFLCRTSLGHPLNWVKHGVVVVREWLGGLWSSLRGQQRGGGGGGGVEEEFGVSRARVGGDFPRAMESPAENETCSICHDPFTLPCQANCAHWFCAECILRVWQHTSALQPCKCPICRRSITLLIPSDVPSMTRPEERSEQEVLSDIAKYNRIFGGGVVSLVQRVRDMPLLLRRLAREMMDPRRAITLVHRTPILFYLLFLAVYVFSPLDIIPEAIVGLVGLLDDLLVIVVVLFYLAMLYRSTLVLHHGGRS